MAVSSMRKLAFVLWGLLIACGLGACVLYFYRAQSEPTSGGIGGGSYSLVDQTGAPLDQSMLKGHPSLLFFGYTHCPDVCPTTMAEMQVWFRDLGDDAKNLKGYFVSVDPERDTPDVMHGYVSWVSDRMVGVTGSRAEIDKIIKAWHIYAEKVPTSDGDYTMNHTATVFLVGDNGEFEGTIDYGEDKKSAEHKIRNLITKS